MPSGPRPLRAGRPGRLREALAHALGVTRVARVTGLDRTGVEVASAVRPRGHVLSVSNGKGRTFEAAVQGALHEAAELWAAERPVSLVSGTPAEVRARFGAAAVLAPADLGPDAFAPEARVAWCTAEELHTGARVLVPAAAVFCPPPGTPSIGPANVRWTSNGMGAAAARGRAVQHALCELVERDRVARALPGGFTREELGRRLVRPETLPAGVLGIVRELEGRRFGVHLLDLELEPVRGGGRRRSPPFVFAALLVDLDGGPVPVAAGYACRLDPAAALEAALLEAAQSRATEIHGAREDVAAGDRTAGAPLAPLLARARPVAACPPAPRASGAEATRGALLAAAPGPLACVDLSGPGDLQVVKLVAPALRLSELLR